MAFWYDTPVTLSSGNLRVMAMSACIGGHSCMLAESTLLDASIISYHPSHLISYWKDLEILCQYVNSVRISAPGKGNGFAWRRPSKTKGFEGSLQTTDV
eukprot:479667-Amphidinium_carterae.1